MLIVEDDEQTRAMYRDAVQHASYDLTAVEDGLDALRHIEHTLPAVVVLDLVLPRVGGWDVFKKMRANPETRHIPVVIVTGSDARELEAGSRRYFLRKPVSPEALVDCVEKAARRARAESLTRGNQPA